MILLFIFLSTLIPIFNKAIIKLKSLRNLDAMKQILIEYLNCQLLNQAINHSGNTQQTNAAIEHGYLSTYRNVINTNISFKMLSD